jgi:ribosome modulation factor
MYVLTVAAYVSSFHLYNMSYSKPSLILSIVDLYQMPLLINNLANAFMKIDFRSYAHLSCAAKHAVHGLHNKDSSGKQKRTCPFKGVEGVGAWLAGRAAARRFSSASG